MTDSLISWAWDAQGQTEDRVSRIVGRIIMDLDGRSGLDFGDFDEDANLDIIKKLRTIVISEVKLMGRNIGVSAETSVGLGG